MPFTDGSSVGCAAGVLAYRRQCRSRGERRGARPRASFAPTRIETAVRAATAKIARANLPDQIAARFQVIRAEPALAGVVIKTWHAELPAESPVAWLDTADHLGDDTAAQTLGIASGADRRSVRSAYRRLARATHPDHHPEDPTAAVRFAEIQDAYERLRADHAEMSPPGQTRTITVAGGAPSVSALATAEGQVAVGSSDGHLCRIDASGRLVDWRACGHGIVRMARRGDDRRRGAL